MDSTGFSRFGNTTVAAFYINQFMVNRYGLDMGEILSATSFTGEIDDTTVHPTAALTWSPVERLNVRLSYTQTVVRPSFREMGPYFTSDEVTNEYQVGNVYLETAKVDNADLRIEYFFPGSRDLVALSLFAKRIENPIERVSFPVTNISQETAAYGGVATIQNDGILLGRAGQTLTLGGLTLHETSHIGATLGLAGVDPTMALVRVNGDLVLDGDLEGLPPPSSVVRDITLSGITGRYDSFGAIKGNPSQTTIGDITLEDIDVELRNGKLNLDKGLKPVIKNVTINGRMLTSEPKD